MTIVYRTYGGPIMSTNERGIRLEMWQDDTNNVWNKYNGYVFTKKQINEYKDTSFDREYALRYMVNGKIPVQAPIKDIISELEDVP